DLTNRQTTALSAVLCLLVPVLDGAVRNNWFWNTYKQGAFDILFIDLLFLALSLISWVILWKLIRKKRTTEGADTLKIGQAATA
ncbi:MAG: hypothetical protein INR69_23840, partial [Mucilaginibacter polytrichastri]|nr:hypothetical protein [Mucilaginibacter polytrichastri]